MMQTLKSLLELWHARAPREQKLLAVLGVLLAGLGYWLLVLAPARAAAQAAQVRFVAASASLLEVEAGTAQLLGGSAAPARVNGGSLRAQLAQSAQAAGLKITRVQPDSDGAVAIWLEPAPAGSVFAWMGGLYREKGIAVKRLTLAKGEAGLTQAQVAFSAPAAK